MGPGLSSLAPPTASAAPSPSASPPPASALCSSVAARTRSPPSPRRSGRSIPKSTSHARPDSPHNSKKNPPADRFHPVLPMRRPTPFPISRAAFSIPCVAYPIPGFVASPIHHAQPGIAGQLSTCQLPMGSSSAGGHALLFKRARDKLDSRGEDADDCEAVDETRLSRRPAAKRRTRAADVHNQSERRRRDRINEKMKALQELVPHCNKSDKASILDEAIEYLKSLQLQVQIMWMTTGMAPMMFPGAHQLMPQMAMGLNPGCVPAAQSLSQLQRVAPFMNNPLQNQMSQVQSPATNSQNVTNQMQINGICEPRNPFLHPNDTLAAAAQVPSMFPYGSQHVQHNKVHELLASTAPLACRARPQCSSDRTGT